MREIKYKIADIEQSNKGRYYFARPRYISEDVFFTKLYEKLRLITHSAEERAKMKQDFLEGSKEGKILLIKDMKFSIEYN